MKPNCTILIVDDEHYDRVILQKLFNETATELAFAGTGQEALNKAASLFPDIILLDVIMPDMDGFEVCRQLRADPLLAEVPILLLTALNDRESRLAGLEAGADDFISKPFDQVELKARVQAITRLNRYRRLLIERIKFEKVVEQAEDGYLIVGGDDQIRYANPAARIYLGLPKDLSTEPEKPFLKLAQQQYQTEPYAAWGLWPAESDTEVPRYLIRPESGNTKAFWLQVNRINLPAASDKDEMIVQLIDVTQQMNLQRSMNSFHSMISHKLRTPLISMISGLELIGEHAENLSTTEIIEFAQIALNGVQRLQGQIEDVLTYLNTPYSQKLAESTFNLNYLADTITKLTDNLEVESVTLQGLETVANCCITLSSYNMEMILWEVLENAKKFHPKQTPSIEITIAPLDNDKVQLSIIDDGVHLSPEQLKRVLAPYYQGEKLFTGEIEGMGLGLSTAAAVVWGAGGQCQVYNRPDKPGVIVEYTLRLLPN